MLNWDAVETVFLDMDGTLLDLHFDNHFWLQMVPQRYAQKHDLDLAESKRLLYAKMMAIRGQLEWYSTTYWTNELGLPIIELKQEASHLIGLRPQVLEFLTALRANAKQVVLFTNAHQDTLNLKMQQIDLTPYFDALISSHHLGLPKEANGVWDAVQLSAPFDGSKTLFIDDSFTVLDEAGRYGIAHLFGIAKPDSSQASLAHGQYTLLDSFNQIMPA